jgi:hypothetical protein
MTPKEKAEELVDKFRISKAITESYAKQCALIAVEEIMSALTYLPYGLNYLNQINYWEEVKQEIELL